MRELNTVLLTGFDPFWVYRRNVSQMAVEKITEAGEYTFKVVGRTLPTSFNRAPKFMAKAIKEVNPDIVLSFGLLDNISSFRIERIGLNIDHAIYEDVDGDKPIHLPILDDTPLAYETTLPFQIIVSQLEKAGLPVEVSYHAETFVCNHLIYSTMHLIHTKNLPVIYGFFHLPPLPEDVSEMPLGTPCLSLDTVLKGLNIILQTLPMI